MKWVSYTRSISSRIGEENPSNTIAEQNERIARYLKKCGCSVSEKYSDRKRTAEATEGFDKLVQDGMARKFDAVVVDSIFRCGRTLPFAIEALQRTFYPLGIQFAVVEDDFCSADKTAEEVAEYFNGKTIDKIRSEFITNRQNHFEEGTLTHRQAKYGYALSEDRRNLVLNPESAQVVKLIFQMYLEDMKIPEIARAFDKDWTGFSAEEYREASESVMKEPDVTVTADVKKRLDLTGYEIVRVQYFSTMQNPAMTISNGRLRFNTACLKKFENVEYVELLLNSVERCIAIRPCDKNNPNAIRWGRLKEGRWCASTLGCRGLAKTLFDIMEWDEDLRYRFRGQFLEQGDNKMMLFAFDEPEMIKVEEIVLPPKENTEEDEGETVKKKIYIFPPEWAGTFGQPITSIAQVGILRQEHYAGNWDVFRPATEIEEMNIFTAESLNELLREAEKIMEGWTDYR